MNRAALVLCLALAACRPTTAPDGPTPELTFGAGPWWPDTSSYAGVGDGKVLLVNGRDDTISLFELSSLGGPLVEAARPNVGFSPVEIEAPHHAAIEPGGEFYYVGLSQYAPGVASGPHGAHGTGTIDGSLLKIRARDNVRVASVRVDRNPGDLVLSPDGKTIAISHYDQVTITDALRNGTSPDARVLFVDTQSMEVTRRVTTCPAPHGVAFSKDGATVYVACYSDELAIITVADGTVKRVKVAPNAGDAFTARYQPYGLALSPDGKDVWVACQVTGETRVYEVAQQAFNPVRTAISGGRPVMPSVSADGQRLWVPHQGDGRVSDFDPATGQRRRVLSLPAACINPHHAIEAPGGGKLLVACEGDGRGAGRLVVLDVASGTSLADAPTGATPDFVGVMQVPR